MDSSNRIIQNFLMRARISAAVLGILKGCLCAIPWLSILVLALGFLDLGLELSSGIREVCWFLMAGAGVGVFLHSLWPFKFLNDESLSKSLHGKMKQVLRSDDFHIGIQFVNKTISAGTSEVLAQETTGKIAALLNESSPSWCFPPNPWKTITVRAFVGLSVVLLVLFPLQGRANVMSRILFPFGGTDLSRFIRIAPGNETIPYGGSAKIELTLLKDANDKPELYTKTGPDWAVLPPSEELKRSHTFSLDRITNPILYRVRFRHDWSPVFVLTPEKPLAIDHFLIVLKAPAYLERPPVEQSNPEIRGVAGSEVEIRGRLSALVKEATLTLPEGVEQPVLLEDGRVLKVGFTLTKEGTYGFNVITVGGKKVTLPDSYPMHVVVDHPPVLHLLSPSEDLLVNLNEKIPVTLEASDDFGVKKILLEWQTGSRKSSGVIQEFLPTKSSVLMTHEWDLREPHFLPGDVIRYRVGASDANSVTGPGFSWSDWRVIEIASFDKTHEALEQALSSWRDEAVNLLADVNVAKSSLETPAPNFEKTANDFSKTMTKSHQMEQMLKKIVSTMENDPMSDYGVWLEHKKIAEELDRMNRESTPSAMAALQTKNKSAATDSLDQMASDLERMLALSENLNKEQKARDVVQSADALEKLSNDLDKQLQASSERGKGLDEKTKKEVMDMVNEAMKEMAQMMKSLQKMPNELPEDFVNSSALKNLELDKSEDLLSQLSDAIQKGDAERAKKLAHQMLEAAKRMKKQLDEAHDDFLGKNSSSELEKKLKEQADKLRGLANEERSLLADTQSLESKRLKTAFDDQEKKLEHLAKKQEKVIEKTAIVSNDTRYPQPAPIVFQSMLRTMKSIDQEFLAKRVQKSPAYLKEMIDQSEKMSDGLRQSSSTAALAGAIDAIKKGEEEILSELLAPEKGMEAFNDIDRQRMKDLSQKQSGVREKTNQARRDIMQLSRKTALIQGSLAKSISDAAVHMQNAEVSLTQTDSQNAQQSEEKAIEALENGLDEMSQAQDQMGDMGMGEGEGPGGRGRGAPRVVRRMGSGPGNTGRSPGVVKLPRAEDFRPPRAFREELLEALKEKYPKIYEDIIQKYYKHLAD